MKTLSLDLETYSSVDLGKSSVYAVLRRNVWMVQRSDVIVAYVLHSWGGAAKTLDYARKKKKIILQYEE